jgi:cytochrome c oxidase subunit II
MTFRFGFVSRIAAAASAMAIASSAAMAAQPTPWGINMQPAVTPIAERMHDFNAFINIIIVVIVLFVLGLLIWCVMRFNEKSNPTPSRTTHHTLLEVAWTVVPVLILVVIAVPSFRLLYAQYDMPEADLTIKVTGKQWFWTYDYQITAPAGQAAAPAGSDQAAAAEPAAEPAQGDTVTGKPAPAAPETATEAVQQAVSGEAIEFSFDSIMVPTADLKEGQPRLLAVDNEIVVPVGANIRVQVTAADVMHNFTVPAFGIKVDAIPGRLNETWFRAEREGVYYGQCSELCGRDHAFMPIQVRVASEADYQAWVGQARERFASNSAAPARVVAEATAASANR